MQKMSADEIRAFLAAGTRTGVLATVRSDGRPHAVPIWFHLDGDDLLFMTQASTVKARNLTREPRVVISVDEEEPPYAFVSVEGVAQVLEPDPEMLLAWSTRIARRYMGDALAESYGRRNAAPGELLIRVRPTKRIAWKNLAD